MSAAVRARRPSSQRDWFEGWFDSAHYHQLYAYRNDEEAADFIAHLIERRHIAAGARVLDLGCGTGRHSRYLASRGLDVTGLDLSAESLQVARMSEGPSLRFIRQDMRLPFRARQFDHVVNLFTSFGYFEDPADHMSVVHNIAQALKPDGTLIVDYLNVRHAEAHLGADDVVEKDGVVYRLRRWSDAHHIFKHIVIDERLGEPQLEFVERVAKLTIEDFRFMFELCDLRIEEVYGNYQLAQFDEARSPRLIVVARKRRGSAEDDLPSREVLANATDGLGRHTEIRGEHRLWNALRD